MDNRNVVLRVLNGEKPPFLTGFAGLSHLPVFFGDGAVPPIRLLPDSANATERHGFLNFASFLAQLGPHPFLPELLGVVSLRAPLVTVMEELANRDLLSMLWRCREVEFTVCWS